MGVDAVDRGPEHRWLQIPGWLLLAYLVYAQAIPAFDYELGIRMGTQESAQRITEVGVAFWYGFAFADLVIYIPLLGAGLIGRLVLAALIILPMWKGAHHMRHVAIDMGGAERDAVVAPLLYLTALLGSLAGIVAVIRL